jgi:CRISPR/Cas system-associated exonuclease Cas4 (RecB family)
MPITRKRPVKPKPAQRKLTPALKVRAEVRKQNSVLLGDIQAHVVKQVAQGDADRRTDIIHPSEMAKADWCPRATSYRILGHLPADEAIGYGTASIFETGNTAHTKWQTWLWRMGRLYGKWKCLACDHTWMDTAPITCERCGSPALEYREVPLDGEDRYLVAGHADGAVPDIRALIEIKTIGTGTIRIEEPDLVRKHTKKTTDGKTVLDLDSLWNGIKRPFPSHRRQGQIYLHLANKSGLEVDRIVFLYENKANQQPKEFSITYDPDYTHELFELARDVKFAVAEGTVLDRPEGYDQTKAPCKKCPFLGVCWEDNDGQDSHSERDTGDGAPQPGGEAEAGAARDHAADETEERRPRTAGRSHRRVRRRADEAVHEDDQVERVPERTGGCGGDRRTVRRRRRREDQGPEEP